MLEKYFSPGFQIDPKFAHLSPYNYASNSPVTNIDLWGLQGIHSQEVMNNGEKRHVIEKNVVVLTQPHKTIPEGASERKIARINRQNSRITASNASKIKGVSDELNSFYSNAKNSDNEAVSFKFNVTGVQDFDKSNMTRKEINNKYEQIAKENGIEGLLRDFNGKEMELLAPAAILTRESAGADHCTTTGASVMRVNYDSPNGSISHEVLHTLGVPDNGYNKGGLLNSPPNLIISNEVDSAIKNSYEKID